MNEAASETIETSITKESSTMVTGLAVGTQSQIKQEVTETVTTVTTTTKTTSCTIETVTTGVKTEDNGN